MLDIRRLVRGAALQALYELELTDHKRENVLQVRSNTELLSTEINIVSYLAMRHRVRKGLQDDAGPIHYELNIFTPADQRTPVQQALIDYLTEDIDEIQLDELRETGEDIIAELEQQILVADVEEFDIRLTSTEDLLPAAQQERIINLANVILDNRPSIDEIIYKHAADYPMEEMWIIERNILRIAVYEAFVSKQTPHPVAISEAVELAQIFGAETSPRFVNAVLRSISREMFDTNDEAGVE